MDNEGNSALHYASAWGHATVMDLLVVSVNVVLMGKKNHLYLLSALPGGRM
jgi:ankyrin repeat protein